MSSLEGLIRQRLKAHLEAEGHGSKSALGRALGLRPSSVTDLLMGRFAIRLNTLEAIARYMGTTPTALISVPLSPSVTATVAESPSQVTTGERHGTETDLLRAKLAEAEKELATLRQQIEALASEIVDIVSAQAARPAGHKSRSRRAD